MDIGDLCERIDAKSLNRRALESLAKAGAFDDLMPRGAMVASAADVLRRARRAQELRESGQTSMFDLFGNEVATPTPLIEEHDEESIDVTPSEQLHWERELLGAYVSQHPLQAAAQALQPHVTNSLSELQEDLIGQTVTVAGLVNNVRQLTTRKGDQFCAVEIEDLSGVQELTVWPEQWRATKAIWTRTKSCSPGCRSRPAAATGSPCQLNTSRRGPTTAPAPSGAPWATRRGPQRLRQGLLGRRRPNPRAPHDLQWRPCRLPPPLPPLALRPRSGSPCGTPATAPSGRICSSAWAT